MSAHVTARARRVKIDAGAVGDPVPPDDDC
jgi:hypothetical protein